MADTIKNLLANAGDPDSISGFGRSPEERTGYPLQCSCLENSMDGGVWRVTVHGVANGQTELSDQRFHFHFTFT